jgi:alpha-ketoglutarate-dependent taurine dioxygenase
MPDLNKQLSNIERKIEAVEVKLRECSDQEEKKYLREEKLILLRSQVEEKLILLRSQEEEKLILLRGQESKEEKELILLRSQERAGKF